MREQWAAFLPKLADLYRCKFKLSRVEAADTQAATVRTALWLAGRRADGQHFETKLWFRMHLVKRGASWRSDAVGAVITIQVGDQRMSRLVSAGSGYASQQSNRLYFGLDQAGHIDQLTVRRPGNKIQNYGELQANQLINIIEDNPTPQAHPLQQPTTSVTKEASP